jgi:hypothetical protein
MKILIKLLSIFSTIQLCCQSIELPPDSLIRKYHVNTITTYFTSDYEKSALDNIWKFDQSGNLISKELIDKDDPSVSKDLYFYKDNRKVEHWAIGTWTKYDTLRTTFYYDEKNRLITTVTKGKYGMFDRKLRGLQNTTSYKYLNDTICIVTYEGNNLTASQSGPDSLIYNSAKLLTYQFSKSNDLITSYVYNGQGQLVLKTVGSISDPTYIRTCDKFIYKNGLLIREEHLYTDFEDKTKQAKSEYDYINNSKGLLEKIQRPFNYNTYKYEFYK